MDVLNKRILQVLQLDGRLSYAEIGRKVGLSAPSIAERIQKLESLGIITGYAVKLNLGKLGFTTKATITLEIDSKNFKRFIVSLPDFPEIYDCVKVTGAYCVFLKVAVKDNESLENVIDRLSEFGQPNTSIILSDFTERTCFVPVS